MARFTHVCFTLIPWTAEEKEQFKKKKVPKLVNFLVVGLETCPDTGTIHGQGYCELKRQVRQKWLKRWLGNATHLEERWGTRHQCYAYCIKDDPDPYVYGTPPKKTYVEERAERAVAARKMLEHVKEDIRAHPYRALINRSIEIQIWAQRNLWMYRQFVQDIQMQGVGETPRTVTVFWGPTGTGKTRRAVDACYAAGVATPFIITFRAGQTPWFDGYAGQSHVVFDEFDPYACPVNDFKRLTDRYPLLVDVKGARVVAKWTHVYVTSNVNPATWWQNAEPADREACMRRISETVHLTEPYKPRDARA